MTGITFGRKEAFSDLNASIRDGTFVAGYVYEVLFSFRSSIFCVRHGTPKLRFDRFQILTRQGFPIRVG